MIFETLYSSAKMGELLLTDGGLCHWHLRKDGQLTIREIISVNPGQGKKMLAQLKQVVGVRFIFAKCPQDLEANLWYAKQGFYQVGTEQTKTGKGLILWRLDIVAG